MKRDIYWIPAIKGRLAIMPRPRSGDWLADEVKAWQLARIEVVISLLTLAELRELNLQAEAEVCASMNIASIAYPIPDKQVPANQVTTLALVRKIDTWLIEGKGVAIHCRAGIGRSALLAACVLVVQGITPTLAFSKIEQARGVRVPDTEEQRQWVEHFARHFYR